MDVDKAREAVQQGSSPNWTRLDGCSNAFLNGWLCEMNKGRRSSFIVSRPGGQLLERICKMCIAEPDFAQKKGCKCEASSSRGCCQGRARWQNPLELLSADLDCLNNMLASDKRLLFLHCVADAFCRKALVSFEN